VGGSWIHGTGPGQYNPEISPEQMNPLYEFALRNKIHIVPSYDDTLDWDQEYYYANGKRLEISKDRLGMIFDTLLDLAESAKENLKRHGGEDKSLAQVIKSHNWGDMKEEVLHFLSNVTFENAQGSSIELISAR
jgi:hypothetical protein